MERKLRNCRLTSTRTERWIELESRFYFVFLEFMDPEEDEILLAAYRRFKQQGGNPIFRAEFTPVGQNCSFRQGVVQQRKFRPNICQLGTPDEEDMLGEAITEAIIEGLRRVVLNEDMNVNEYNLLVALHSNSFSNLWSQSAKNIPLSEWLLKGEYTRAWMEVLVRKLNSAQVINQENDGFFAEIAFIRRIGRGGRKKKKNPGR